MKYDVIGLARTAIRFWLMLKPWRVTAKANKNHTNLFWWQLNGGIASIQYPKQKWS